MREVTHLVRHRLIAAQEPYFDHMVLVIAADAPRWYQQVTSLNWFNERELKRVYGQGEEMQRRAWRGEIEYATTEILTPYTCELFDQAGYGQTIAELPVVRSVWEMYERLGYDRVRQRWPKR